MSTPPLLEASGLRKVFPRHTGLGGTGSTGLIAVDDVSFTLPAGGCLAVVGESGSGKTTCARLIAGLESATAGTVTVDGVPWHTRRVSLAERRRRARLVQMVFQDPYLSLDPRIPAGRAIEDVLKLHTGRTGAAASTYYDGEPGLDSDAAHWLAERRPALVGADNFAVERIPFLDGEAFPVHQILIADRGVPLLESVVLDELAVRAAGAFLFVALPLGLVGSTASPLTPVAVL